MRRDLEPDVGILVGEPLDHRLGVVDILVVFRRDGHGSPPRDRAGWKRRMIKNPLRDDAGLLVQRACRARLAASQPSRLKRSSRLNGRLAVRRIASDQTTDTAMLPL